MKKFNSIAKGSITRMANKGQITLTYSWKYVNTLTDCNGITEFPVEIGNVGRKAMIKIAGQTIECFPIDGEILGHSVSLPIGARHARRWGKA